VTGFRAPRFLESRAASSGAVTAGAASPQAPLRAAPAISDHLHVGLSDQAGVLLALVAAHDGQTVEQLARKVLTEFACARVEAIGLSHLLAVQDDLADVPDSDRVAGNRFRDSRIPRGAAPVRLARLPAPDGDSATVGVQPGRPNGGAPP